MLYKYCAREKLEFTRSRPCHKNDNAYIEEKNWTHVRKVLVLPFGEESGMTLRKR